MQRYCVGCVAPSRLIESPGWAQIDVEMAYLEEPAAICRTCLRLTALQALEFSWAGIPGEFVTYTVQWRTHAVLAYAWHPMRRTGIC